MKNLEQTIAPLKLYGESFPFRPIEEELLDQLNFRLEGEVSLLLRAVYAAIGRGYYFMTTPFFEFDIDLRLTHDLRGSLSQKAIIDYVPTNRELIVGIADEEHIPATPVVFFVGDFSDDDPIVHCLSTVKKRIIDKSHLSQVLHCLRGFPDCRNVPQGVFDYYWYIQHFSVPADHNAALLSIEIMDWVTAGRTGMEEKFRNHSVHGHESISEEDSVFSSMKYVV